MTAFDYKGWTLADAIDALKAYDHGATDSGVNDSDMRWAVRMHLQMLTPEEHRRTIAVIARDMLSNEQIDCGYGLDDVVKLAEWLDEIESHYEP